MTNVLADRHHSGLYHSLQLMARRFGWTLYTPIGIEWWDSWTWSFGRGTYNDDRLAQQFLVGVAGPDGLGPLPDGEFPDWPINGVTLDDAKRMDWAFVIATAQDNQGGFAKFAKEVGAQLVFQVGNTGQFVEWNRDPLALVSSEVPIVGRGIRYHQEMDPIPFADPAFAFRHAAASFVNCMPSMGRCWDLLQEARRDLVVFVHGIDGEAGIVKPFSQLLGIMGLSGWGWHDKGQGDGFGHVIHSWAAVGRPLIGHASHYRGRMAEPFWQDMVTCIDLDRHTIAETVEIVQGISAEDHAAMCRAIRAEFERIDYDAEAREIAALLGIGTAVAA